MVTYTKLLAPFSESWQNLEIEAVQPGPAN